MKKKVLIRGGGDLASAVIQKLHRTGFKVVVKELEKPKMVRQTVSFSNAVYEGNYFVEGIESVFLPSVDGILDALKDNKIPVLTIPENEIKNFFRPDIFIDATLSKKGANYNKDYAEIVIGLGPSICAGKDADFVIETKRGHNLGRIIFNGYAIENTHVPGNIEGYTYKRVLRAPCDGKMKTNHKIGDMISEGDIVMKIGNMEVKSQISGVIRGLIHPSVAIKEGFKIGDIDPRGDINNCFTISDKGRNIAGGVLEGILICMSK